MSDVALIDPRLQELDDLRLRLREAEETLRKYREPNAEIARLGRLLDAETARTMELSRKLAEYEDLLRAANAKLAA